ncbi:hypothetical protein AB0953_17570 [Streptomyces sp. NPDC046866]|uniref:hypothetical protein n=1 Tax=Streptomyces sp. NPDC046866 TaxID=3154921 RepID=UPI0034555CBB
MTQSSPQPPESATDAEETKPAAAAGQGRARLVRLVREGRARWVALGLVVAVGGGAAAVAVAEHHHGERGHARFAAEGREHGHGGKQAGGPFAGKRHKSGEPAVVDGKRGWPAPAAPGQRAGGGLKAPAPLPSLPAAQALEKAAAAVEGGKVEALRSVPQEGGKSGWLAVVIGPDGVRHAVTLSGEDGTVTSNSVAGRGLHGAR